MTTELDRQIAVAEEWGRRGVMEPVTNAERMEKYEAVKALHRCAVDINVTSRAAPCVTKAPDRTIARLKLRPLKSNRTGAIFG